MLTPEQIANLPDNLVKLYEQVEADIIADMAKRIRAMDYFIPAVDWQFAKMTELGNSYDMVLKRLQQATGKTKGELQQLMVDAGSESLKYDDKLHRAAGKKIPPAYQSEALLVVLNAGAKKTSQTFINLCKTTAAASNKQFSDALDRAYMQVTSGAFSPDEAIKMAVKSLAESGLTAITYKGGRTMSLEAAVRMNITTGVNQTCAELQLARANEAGCDLVEVTAHPGARPDHAEWQGKVYTLSGKNKKYDDFQKSTGYGAADGLCGVNCRHNFFPFYEDSQRAYSREELKQLQTETVTYNGQKLTRYEASQVQRKIERNIRRWKREQEGMKAAGLDTTESAAKVKQWRDKMNDFVQQTGLKRQYARENVVVNTVSNNDKLPKKPKTVTIKEKTFIPAAKIAEAEEFARVNLGIQNVSYRGVDIAIANEWNRGLNDSLHQFPELRNNFGFVGEIRERNEMLKPIAKQYYLNELVRLNPTLNIADLEPYAEKKVKELMKALRPGDSYAQSWAPTKEPFSLFRGVSVNRKWGKKPDEFIKALREDVAVRFHPVGCDTIKSVLDHEIGHQLDSLLKVSELPEIQKLFDTRTHDEITKGLSEYAWKNNNSAKYSEMVAEAWAEYCNNPQPREIAKVVGEIIEAEYKKKIKK